MTTDVKFCERNVRGWLVMLALVATGVLGLALKLAWEKGKLSFVKRPQNEESTYPSAAPIPAIAPGPLVAQPQGAAPAGYAVVALPAPAPQPDMVTAASPGIRFVNGPITMPQGNGSFHQAASQIRPSVVSISAMRLVPFAPVANIPGGATAVGQQSFETVGSGVIVDQAGYVVTNRHVIAGAMSIIVSLPTRPVTHLSAEVIKAEEASDLALLKIPSTGALPTAILADSSRVQVGDWVLAVGYPFGLDLTVTSGIISGKRISMNIGGRPYRGLFQTDAPINKGSSGGPLVDLNGHVIGINTAIYAPTGVFSGTGFAIPSNLVGAFVARALERGQAWPPAFAQPAATPMLPYAQPAPTWPQTAPMQMPLPAATAAPIASTVWMGLGVKDMTLQLAETMGYPYQGGVYVASVVIDSPADEAEIARGDVIIAMAGQTTGDRATLEQVLSSTMPGQPVSTTIWRGGKTETLVLRMRPR